MTFFFYVFGKRWDASVQAKYGPLTSTSTGVQRGGEPLPSFEQLSQRVQACMKITVRDVWGLMLTALPGELTGQCYSCPGS
jgi:hypothetical protein